MRGFIAQHPHPKSLPRSRSLTPSPQTIRPKHGHGVAVDNQSPPPLYLPCSAQEVRLRPGTCTASRARPLAAPDRAGTATAGQSGDGEGEVRTVPGRGEVRRARRSWEGGGHSAARQGSGNGGHGRTGPPSGPGPVTAQFPAPRRWVHGQCRRVAGVDRGHRHRFMDAVCALGSSR